MRRILAATVIACLLVPAAVVAAKPPKPVGTVTLTAAPARVTFGGAVALAGRLTGARTVSGQSVVVEADVAPIDGHWTNAATATTDANGDWHVAQTPAALTRYRAQVKSAKATSATADVAVRLRVGVHVSDRSPSRGERVRFSGTVAPAHDGAPAKVQRRTAGGGWHTVARTTLQDAGTDVSRYAKRVRVRHSGTYRVRALSGDADHLAGTSRRRRLTVG
jgi:hypothetical protein